MLNIQSLSYSVAGKKILNDLHFELNPGEFLAILGPNGSGKSSLLKCIAREKNPKQLAFLRHAELPWIRLSVKDYVELGRYPYEEMAKESQKFAEAALEFVAASAFKTQEVHTLSSGEFQRVALARALAQLGLPGETSSETRILLLDELLAHLDPFYQLYFLDRLKSLKNVSIMAVMHELNLAYTYADKFLMIKTGRNLEFGDRSIMTEKNLSALFNTTIKAELFSKFHHGVSGG